MRIHVLDQQVYDEGIGREIDKRECRVQCELRTHALSCMVFKRPIFLKNETSEHCDEKRDDGAGEIWHAKHIQRMKCAEIYAKPNYADDTEFQDAHSAIVASAEMR